MGLRGFNLLKTQPTPPTVWEKFYAWVLGTARTVIIVVQIVVIGAFVTRIIVDTQAKRLEKDIERKEMIISGFKESEKRYRIIQDRTTHFSEIWKDASNYYPVVEEIDSLLFSNFADLRIGIEGDIVTLRGQGNIQNISDLETKLKASSSFYNVEAFEIQAGDGLSSGSVGNFGLRALIKSPSGRSMEVFQTPTNTNNNTIN